jgi:hypothetical protein
MDSRWVLLEGRLSLVACWQHSRHSNSRAAAYDVCIRPLCWACTHARMRLRHEL